MTNEEILRIAMEQSAKDESCQPEDFLREENVVVISKPSVQARKYLKLPYMCNLVSYGNNIVVSIQPQIRNVVENYIGNFPLEHCFETPKGVASALTSRLALEIIEGERCHFIVPLGLI